MDNEFPNASSVKLTVDGEEQEITRHTTAYAITARHGDEFYYKINLPAFVEGSTSACALKANLWYMLDLDISVLGSPADDGTMVIDGSNMGVYVCDWAKPSEMMGGDINGGRYLSTAKEEYTFSAVNSITIPVVSSHTIAARILSAERKINGTWTSVPKTQSGEWTRGSVTTSGTNSLTLTNVLNNTMGSNLDCYPFRFVVKISQKNSDGSTTGTLSHTVTITQYPPIYVERKDGGNAFVDGYYGNVDGTSHGWPGGQGTADGATWTPYAPIANSVNTTQHQLYMTVISISSFGPNNTFTLREYRQVGGNQYTDRTYPYILIDPRVDAGFGGNDLIAYWNGSGTTNWNNTQANAIKKSITTEKSYISPRFMISSSYGRMGNWHPDGTHGQQTLSDEQRFEIVQKRCATYQEAGYPAGRWRLPTPAEIAFIGNLQRYSLLGQGVQLFTPNGYSISATGDVFTVSGNNVNVNHEQGTSCRCVYDLWYWGEDPVADPATYTVAPTMNN